MAPICEIGTKMHLIKTYRRTKFVLDNAKTLSAYSLSTVSVECVKTLCVCVCVCVCVYKLQPFPFLFAQTTGTSVASRSARVFLMRFFNSKE